MHKNIYSFVSIDSRALGLFRIFIGLIVLIDVLLRFRNFNLFYSENGAIPRSVVVNEIPSYALSFHTLTGNDTIMIILFILQILFSIQLIIGYKTRFASLIVFMFVVSINFRGIYLDSYSDVLLKLLLFWSIFLPLGEKWSVDSFLRNRQPCKNIASLPSLLILSQMISMYIINGYHKYQYSEEWILTDTAIKSLLDYSIASYLLSDYIMALPDFLLVLFSTLWILLLITSPLLLLFDGKKRTLFTFAFIFIHIGILLSFRVGAFSVVSISGLILFVHSGFFDYIENKITKNIGNNIKSVTWKKTLKRPQFNNKTLILIYIILIITGCYMYVSTLGYISPVPDERSQIYGINEIDSAYERISVDQPEWGFFPDKIEQDTIYIAVAETDEGNIVDLYSKERIGSDDIKNHSINRYYKSSHTAIDTYRHRFYYTALYGSPSINNDKTNNLKKEYLEYLCDKEYNNSSLESISLYQIEYGIGSKEIDLVATLDSKHGCKNNNSENLVGSFCVSKS